MHSKFIAYFIVHDRDVQEQRKVMLLRESIAVMGSATLLNVGQIRDKLANHLVLCPIDFCRIVQFAVSVALVSAPEIG